MKKRKLNQQKTISCFFFRIALGVDNSSLVKFAILSAQLHSQAFCSISSEMLQKIWQENFKDMGFKLNALITRNGFRDKAPIGFLTFKAGFH